MDLRSMKCICGGVRKVRVRVRVRVRVSVRVRIRVGSRVRARACISPPSSISIKAPSGRGGISWDQVRVSLCFSYPPGEG